MTGPISRLGGTLTPPRDDDSFYETGTIPDVHDDGVPVSGPDTIDYIEDSWNKFQNTGNIGGSYFDYADSLESSKQTVDWIANNLGADSSVSEYMRNHPGATPEEVLEHMASTSDEWAEKYLDYLMEKQGLDEANRYTAEREDTAYQRLVADLKAAGINPALLYGGSGSISASGSAGYVRQNSGANSRAVNGYDKMKRLLLAILSYQLYSSLDTVDTIFKNGKRFTDMFDTLFTAFN